MSDAKPHWKQNADRYLRPFILTLAAIGLLLFGAGFAASFADRTLLEDNAKIFVKSKVTEEARERFPLLEDDTFVAQTEALKARFAGQAEKYQSALDGRIDEIIAKALSPDETPEAKESRGRIRDFVKSAVKNSINVNTGYQDRLTNFAKDRYEATLSGLVRDVRIFTGATALAFLMVLIATAFKYRGRRHIILPAGLLFLSAGLSVYFYIFTQNWFYVLLSNNFMGFAYAIWMGVIYAFLLDIGLNKARVTEFLGNCISSFSIG